jgi:hypothetical protein
MSKAKFLQISPRIVEMLSKATIRSWAEAVVELITNCDDSYKRLGNQKIKSEGKISLFISRKVRGEWQEFRITDEAEGMDRKKLEKALIFSEDTNEYKEHNNVRGFFGRGLKETIVALGIGEIATIKDNRINVVRLWFDKKQKAALYDFIVEDEKVNEVIRKEYDIKKNGTRIKIEVTNENIKIPEFVTIEQQIKEHISLRDIVSSDNRKIELSFEDLRRGIKRRKTIKFEYPSNKKILDKELSVPGYKSKVFFKLYEYEVPFPFKKHYPFNLAGILIKTKGAVLDNQLFKFENDPASYYFYGEIISEEVDSILRSGDTSILNPSRTGLEWGNDYARLLATTIERELSPFIEQKKKELSKNKKIEVNKENQKLLDELSKLFNSIFDKELGEGNIELNPEDVFEERVFIKPERVILFPQKARTLCFYAHENIVKRNGERVLISNLRNKVLVLDEKIILEQHSKYPNMFLGRFKVKGIKSGEEDIIEAKLNEEKALCDVKVRDEEEQKEERKKRKNLSNAKKGSITGFDYDSQPTPLQRSFHDATTGKIIIYTQFPGVSKYIGESLENLETDVGRMLLCEITCEAMFRKLAKARMKKGDVALFGESDADAYQNEVNELQKRYLDNVYSLVMNWEFGEKKSGEQEDE